MSILGHRIAIFAQIMQIVDGGHVTLKTVIYNLHCNHTRGSHRNPVATFCPGDFDTWISSIWCLSIIITDCPNSEYWKRCPNRPRPFLVFRKFEIDEFHPRVGLWGTKRKVLIPWSQINFFRLDRTYGSLLIGHFWPWLAIFFKSVIHRVSRSIYSSNPAQLPS